MTYAYQGTESKIAKACSVNENVSWKNSNEVCYTIKGMKAKKALEYLSKVQEKTAFVPLRRYHGQVPHRKGGIPGRYPIKAARIVKKVLSNAIANAEYKGYETDNLMITYANAYKGLELPRGKPKGKMHPSNIELTTIEIVVREA